MLTILQGDAIEQLRTLPDESIHCCVTSPPYWGLRDYSTNGQLGLEKTPEEYVAKMVEVFREVRRVLRKDGTCFVNLGDSYWNGGGEKRDGGHGFVDGGKPKLDAAKGSLLQLKSETKLGLKPKDLCGIPWRVAFALQADGWWLRSDIIWAKPNPMPESVTDRPTKAHEYLFLLTKSANYFYDGEAIREPHTACNIQKQNGALKDRGDSRQFKKQGLHDFLNPAGRNKRTVWTVATAPYPEAHFATYPPDLIKPCILAGTSAKGCCAKCGNPWERIVEKGESSWEARKAAGHTVYGLNPPQSFDTPKVIGRKNEGGLGWVAESKTIGWQPTCDCFGVNPLSITVAKPCTVLDLFAGSGTTGAVALELGRKAVLIELNPKYVELIKTRCNITPGLQLA